MTTAKELERRRAILTPALMKQYAPFKASLAAWRWRLAGDGKELATQGVYKIRNLEGVRVHVLKTCPTIYPFVVSGAKPFEVRVDDRVPRFNVGDGLLLREWQPNVRNQRGRVVDPNPLVGFAERRLVSFVLRGEQAEFFGVRKGYCVLGLA